MDNILRDLSRLNLIREVSIGQENLTPFIRVQDFITYYFKRFITNVSHISKDFSTAEIEDFNLRHKTQLETLLSEKTPFKSHLIVPIPKGMVGSYRDTIVILLSLLEEIHFTTLRRDLFVVLQAIKNPSLKYVQSEIYSSKDFEKAKITIGSLFSKNNITHVITKDVFISKDTISHINLDLRKNVRVIYPEVISIYKLIKDFESFRGEDILSLKENCVLINDLMTLAYRLSVAAIVSDHLQSIEHMFVEGLKILLKNTA